MSRFIVFEGINRSGKSTQINRLYDHLKKTTSLKICKTRQPWDEGVRNQIKTSQLTPKQQLDLILRDRADHCEYIREKMKTHDLILCDRFTQSSVAYQGFGGGLGIYEINQSNSIVTKGLSPDLVLIFDCPVNVALKRGTDRLLIEIEKDLYFMERVRWGYLSIARDKGYSIIDSSRSEDLVFFDVLKEIGSVIPNVYSVV